MVISNLGELRRLTEHLPDDTEFIAVSTNFELKGNFVKAHPTIEKAKVEKKQFKDAFDDIVFKKDVYKQDDEGKTVIMILT